jgi:hypothetical protein
MTPVRAERQRRSAKKGLGNRIVVAEATGGDW